MIPRQRSRARIQREIVECAKHRDDATRHLDFDAYQHLTEQMNDLLTELHALPPRRFR